MHRHLRALSVLAGAAVALSVTGSAAATAPPSSEPITASLVARPTTYVVAQNLIELDGATSLQWQLFSSPVESQGTSLDATANLFLFSDEALALASHSSPVASVLTGLDEVIAIPIGSSWTLHPLGDAAATATIFGLGHEAGGTSPAGEAFTVGTSGWYQLEVRAYQLLPGEFAEVGDGSASTLLIVRQGTVTSAAGELATHDIVTVGRSELLNTGDEPADVLAAAVIEIPADLAALLTPGAPTVTTPATTAPPQGTAAPGTTTPTTDAPTTDPPAVPPTANDDSFSANQQPASGNVMANDDRGNPQAVVVSVDGGLQSVGVPYGVGNGTFVLNADGSATFTVGNMQQGATYTYSVIYVIENANGQSTAVATFSITG